MTTVTEPPLITPAIDVAELPALDQPDERVCEITDCEPRQAAWAGTFDCGPCPPELVLMCEPCRSDARQYPFECSDCHGDAVLMRAEPIR